MAHETQPGDGRTDAELLARFERWWSWEGVGTSPAYGQDQDECNYNLTMTAWLNGAYVAQALSGTRPLPTDEVAELRAANATLSARVAELEAEVQALRNGGEPVGPRPFVLNPDGKDRKYWAGTTDLGATFSKPAPGAGQEGRGE